MTTGRTAAVRKLRPFADRFADLTPEVAGRSRCVRPVSQSPCASPEACKLGTGIGVVIDRRRGYARQTMQARRRLSGRPFAAGNSVRHEISIPPHKSRSRPQSHPIAPLASRQASRRGLRIGALRSPPLADRPTVPRRLRRDDPSSLCRRPRLPGYRIGLTAQRLPLYLYTSIMLAKGAGPDGVFELTVGTAEFGDGTTAVHGQIAASILNTTVEHIQIRQSNTELVGMTRELS
jgi:Molybdopterin-binding domain of aldehyde dehydrogenase